MTCMQLPSNQPKVPTKQLSLATHSFLSVKHCSSHELLLLILCSMWGNYLFREEIRVFGKYSEPQIIVSEEEMGSMLIIARHRIIQSREHIRLRLYTKKEKWTDNKSLKKYLGTNNWSIRSNNIINPFHCSRPNLRSFQVAI